MHSFDSKKLQTSFGLIVIKTFKTDKSYHLFTKSYSKEYSNKKIKLIKKKESLLNLLVSSYKKIALFKFKLN